MPITISPYALVDLATAKSMIGIAGSNDDQKVTLFINAATQWIENYCDRTLVKRTGIVETKDGRGSNKLLLRQWPVLGITSVYVDSEHVFTDPSSQLDPSTYGISDEQTTVVSFSQNFAYGYKNVQITYDAGYDQTGIPSDLTLACSWVVEWYYRFNQNRDIGRTSKGKGDENVLILQSMPQLILDAIFNYKRTEFPDLDSPLRNV